MPPNRDAPPTPIRVVKVGGSLLGWPALPERLAAFLGEPTGARSLLIAGGGAFADAVRAFDRTHGLAKEAAHALAVRSMDVSAHALAAILPGGAVIGRFDQLSHAWQRGATPILAPRIALDEADHAGIGPPHSWDVTSDSIAAFVAVRLEAIELVLLKSADPPPGLDRARASALGFVDRAFREIARPLDRVVSRNLRDAEARAILLA